MEPIFIVLIALGGAILALITLYLFAIKTRNGNKDMEKYIDFKYAHRGLHGEGAEENSLTAYERAIEKGYGIEIDIRFSRDGELVVFHDDTLKRVCGVDKRVSDLTVAELKELKLGNTEDTIPTFSELLKIIDGRVPLLIEIKQDMGEGNVAAAAVPLLKEYKGDFLIQSFNPMAVAVFKKEMPHVVRGILSDNYFRSKDRRKPIYFFLKNLMLNFLCRPDFVSFNHHEWKKSFTLRFVKSFYGSTLFAWTLRSEEEERAAKERGFKGMIFENYLSESEKK